MIWILVAVAVTIDGVLMQSVSVDYNAIAYKTAKQCYVSKQRNYKKLSKKYRDIRLECIPSEVYDEKK